MDSAAIKQHWSNWAETYGTDVRATTYSNSSKELEIAALKRWFDKLYAPKATVLDVGCGNGLNCIELAKFYPWMTFYGVDYESKMVEAAIENRAKHGVDNVFFCVGDVLQLDSHPTLQGHYDIVMTDRCLINLNSLESQKTAITKLAAKVRPGGDLLMIENSKHSYNNQNHCRNVLGLPNRDPPAFNLFLDETEIIQQLSMSGMSMVAVEDFISLHDLMLYVLIPAVYGDDKKWQYDHPLVHAVTKISKEVGPMFGAFGQGRLFVLRRAA